MSNTLIIALAALAVLNLPFLRRHLITRWLMPLAAKSLPTIGETERIALEAGTVSFEGEIFSGKPNWDTLLNFKNKPLTKAEQAFVDGPTEQLCSMLDDWQIAQDRDLSPEVWDFIKKQKFLGMIIDKKHGGLGFSAAAHAAVITKIASRSVTAAVTVMVPNSLGPGELLHHYGTPEQKKHYLPRLAVGEDIPCFALTEPHAGSDAASGSSYGVVCEGTWEGKKTLGIKLQFNKRYITLAPIATVVGLAFHLKDPNHLLGSQAELGITCALLPRDIKGMTIGQRHDPGIPFHNGPIQGKDVFIPLDFIIGGAEYAGQGWRMLMEQLSAGRGISLPSLSVGAAEFTTRATTAYATVREQFGLPIGKFEGIRERLVRIAGSAYTMQAMRTMVAGAVDAGERPAVLSAISKAYLTEGMRQCLNDGMDIFAGAAICRGPRNLFTRPYVSIPIGITVEGANILTRSLIVFGQGVMRCHPYLQKEVDALQAGDLTGFDRAFFGHLGHAIKNTVRAFGHGLTKGAFANSPVADARHRKDYQHLTHLATGLALLADIGLISLGGALKRKEYLSGRYADAFAHLSLAAATLKRAHDEGQADHQAIVSWAVTHHLNLAEQALWEVVRNLPNPLLRLKMRALIFPLGRRYPTPTDRQTERVVRALLDAQHSLRDALTSNVYLPKLTEVGLGDLEDAYLKAVKAETASGKLKAAKRKGLATSTASAVKAGVLTKAEATDLEAADKARDKVIQVSDFDPKLFKTLK